MDTKEQLPLVFEHFPLYSVRGIPIKIIQRKNWELKTDYIQLYCAVIGEMTSPAALSRLAAGQNMVLAEVTVGGAIKITWFNRSDHTVQMMADSKIAPQLDIRPRVFPQNMAPDARLRLTESGCIPRALFKFGIRWCNATGRPLTPTHSFLVCESSTVSLPNAEKEDTIICKEKNCE